MVHGALLISQVSSGLPSLCRRRGTSGALAAWVLIPPGAALHRPVGGLGPV